MESQKTIVKNLIEARKLFFRETGIIIDYFVNFSLRKDIVTDNKYSKMPWVDFELKIYPNDMSSEDLLTLIDFREKFEILFSEGCIQINKRYYYEEATTK